MPTSDRKKIDDSRATFSASIRPDSNGRPRQMWSLSLVRADAILSIVGGLLVILTASTAAASWVAKRYVVDIVTPQIEQVVDEKVETAIELHRLGGPHPGAMTEAEIERMVGSLRAEIAGLASTTEALVDGQNSQNKLLEELLLRMPR